MIKPFIVLTLLSNCWIFAASPEPLPKTREDRVREEILTLHGLTNIGRHFEGYRKREWLWRCGAYEGMFRLAAGYVVNFDSEILTNSVVFASIAACLSEDKFDVGRDVGKFIRENRIQDPRFVALGVWRIIISYEQIMRSASRHQFNSSWDSSENDHNARLYRAIAALRSIPFSERPQEILLEVQTYLALRILRCLYIWDPQNRANEIEKFALTGLKDILSSEAHLKMIGDLNSSLSELVLKDEWMSAITIELFKSR